MLQFVTQWPCSRSIPEQVREAVEGGCRWVELSAPGMPEADLRAVAREIIPVCRESEVFVIMRDHLHLAGELRLGGIFLDYSASPRKVREELGGEAIIGVAVHSFEEIMDMRAVDVDYLVMTLTDEASTAAAVTAMTMAREKLMLKPIVAQGEFDREEVAMLVGAGFSGIAVSATIASAPSPAAAVRSLLSALHC